MKNIQVKLIILICLKLYLVKCSSLFQLYDKSTGGRMYEVSSDFKSIYYLSNQKANSLHKCTVKCHQIKQCSIVFINKMSRILNYCEFYSNYPIRQSQIYQSSSTYESQFIFLKKGSEIKTLRYGSNKNEHITPSHSVRLRKDNQLYVEFLDVYYDLEKIRGYNVYYFNGTNLTIGEKNTESIGKIRIDFKNKTLNKINIRTDSTKVMRLQFCWVSQLNFSSSCSSAVGGTGGTNYTFYYDTEFKQFQIEYLIVFNVWYNDNVQFIFNQLNF
ncbi:unnamed protein product [Brachionus calyciflorus]|uniref:Farnesoic acid O-methyl transferase domain-containing protein n=1 Tax=Brachionus calyciflorus TaxID=104777 RepID=A0A813SGU2_9BILA|nr:unnamed protein product [Brachionus calyciflorus]